MPSLFIVIAILIWSSLGIIVRLSEVDVHVLIFYSTTFSLLFQGFMFFSRKFRQAVPHIRKIPYIFLLSTFSLLNTFTFLFAYSKTTIANAVLTHYIAPMIVAVLAAIFLNEQITRRVIISILIASLGLWAMLGGTTIAEYSKGIGTQGFQLSTDLIGIISGLLSGFFYALLVIFARFYVQRINPYVLVFFQNLFIVLLLLPFATTFPADKLWIFLLMGGIHSTLAPCLYYKGLSSVQANRAAALGYLEAVGAIIFSIIFLRELPYLRSYIGGGLIILSGYLTIKDR